MGQGRKKIQTMSTLLSMGKRLLSLLADFLNQAFFLSVTRSTAYHIRVRPSFALKSRPSLSPADITRHQFIYLKQKTSLT
jgi:hypothetical protein